MAYKVFDSGDAPVATHSQTTLQIDGPSVDLPDAAYITDANMMRDGIDLVLEGPDGTIIVEGYFAAEPAPALVAPDGSTLTPGLVDSFLGSEPQYAMTETVSDASPVGAVQEVSGSATVTHVDGSTEAIAVGTPIFEGDVVQTDASGAVNIVFADQTSFAVSEDARLAIDKYVFDPSTQAGETDFSILKGVFVFTSGLIGRDDPDEVHIQTPAGSIGIRGTIIAGNVNTGEITVVEGAIVLRDFQGNEVVLANQFETAKFNMGHGIENMGQVNANDISVKFSSMSAVTPSFFSNIDQTAAEQGKATEAPAVEDAPADTPVDAPVEDAPVAPTDDHSEVAPQATTTMGLANNSGFGNTSGLAPSTSSFSTPTAATMMATSMTSPTMGAPAEPGSAPPPAEVSTATVAGTNTDNSVVDPNTYDPNANNGNGGTTNGAPFSMRSAPAGYFETTSNRDWSFSFNKEFGDPNFAQGDTVTYELSTATINQLNAWQNDGAGGSNDILAASGWNFNATTGQLNLILNGTFSGVTPSTFLSTDIMVRAIDSQGAASGYQTYTFRAYNPFNSMPSGTFTEHSIDGQVFYKDNAGGSGTISSDNSRFYFGTGNDNVTLDSTITSTGSMNYLNLGGGNNILTLANDAYGNIIVGGNQVDSFFVRNADVEAYGMDGDDRFVLDITNGPTLLSGLMSPGSGTILDGGNASFRIGFTLNNTYGLQNTNGSLGGRGDTLEFMGGGTLNFTAMPAANQFKSIERLDLITSTAGQNVTLSYNDIIEMTDARTNHTLVINLGAGDAVNLNGFANMNKLLNNVTLDDGVQGTPDNRQFDVFSDGTITVLINSSNGGTVNFDGVAQAGI